MHRVRQSLPYFKEMGWEVEVVAVDRQHIEAYSYDPMLADTVPADIPVHYVDAWDARKTRKFGFGNIAVRSFNRYRKLVDRLLREKQFDLIYFSTTVFPLMALGVYWKRRFGVPYVLDIQDPWRNDFYLSKPKAERPPKFWIAYTLDKWLEALTVPRAAGIISVSQGYCDEFMVRYPRMRADQFAEIPFSCSAHDYEIMEERVTACPKVPLQSDRINLLYIGRGGHDMQFSLSVFFRALRHGLKVSPDLFSRLQVWFVGTSYAADGAGKKTVAPIAEQEGVGQMVTEITDRIAYLETLFLLKRADILFMPGSFDAAYTASKLYPYILAHKPLLTVFHRSSSVVRIVQETNAGVNITFDANSTIDELVLPTYEAILNFLEHLPSIPSTNWDAFEPYTSRYMTKRQTDFFEHCLSRLRVKQ